MREYFYGCKSACSSFEPTECSSAYPVEKLQPPPRFPRQDLVERMLYGAYPPFHVSFGQYHLGIWVGGQQLIRKQHTWDVGHRLKPSAHAW